MMDRRKIDHNRSAVQLTIVLSACLGFWFTWRQCVGSAARSPSSTQASPPTSVQRTGAIDSKSLSAGLAAVFEKTERCDTILELQLEVLGGAATVIGVEGGKACDLSSVIGRRIFAKESRNGMLRVRFNPATVQKEALGGDP